MSGTSIAKGRLLLRLLRSEGIQPVVARLEEAHRRRRRARSRLVLDFGGSVPSESGRVEPDEIAPVGAEGSLDRAVEMLRAEGVTAGRRGVLHLTSSDPLRPRGGIDFHVADLRKELRRLGWADAVVWTEPSRLLALWGSESNLLWSFDLPAERSARAIRERVILEYLVRALRCPLVHVHDALGFERRALLEQKAPLVLGVHDFQLHCRRPHLMESTSSTFCDFSRDPQRCRRCLEKSGHDHEAASPEAQQAWRRRSADLIDRARALVVPTRYMADRLAELFPGCAVESKVQVIANESAVGHRPGRPRPVSEALRVTFVGQFTPSKGSVLFGEIAKQLAADRRFAFRVLGGIVDHESLRAVRRSVRVETLGWYDRGSLPRLLDPDHDVALLASMVPESWSYTLTETLSAGVPVLGFDLGAIGERLRRIGRQDWLVPRTEGADGFVRRLRDHVEGRLAWPAFLAESSWTSEQRTQRHADLYLDVLDGEPRLAASIGAPS